MSPSTATCVSSLKRYFDHVLTVAFDAHSLPECVDALAFLRSADNACIIA